MERFVERAVVKGGMADVFTRLRRHERHRAMKAALGAVRSHGAHARGARTGYTTSPAHTFANWLDLTEQLEPASIPSPSGYVHSHADGRL